MKRELLLTLCLVLLLGCFQGVLAGDKAQEKRDAVDRMTQQTLDKLLADDPGARALYDQAAAYAVFDSIKVAVGVTGGGGIGAAVDKATGKRTYMKTGTGGIGLGLGGKSFQIIFLFESEKPFRSFLEKGWQAETSAGATAGTVGKDVSSSFVHGVAIYQLTNKGLIAGADVTGTKFWKAKNLNKE